MPVLSVVVFFLAIVATAAISLVRRARLLPGELLRVTETRMTVLLGAALWAESGALLYILIQMPERLDPSSVGNVRLFTAVSLLLGCFAVLYGCVKAVIAAADGFTCVSPLGGRKSIRWAEVTEVRRSGKSLVFFTGETSRLTVSGKREQLEGFARLAAGSIKPEAGEDILEQYLAQFRPKNK